MKFLAKLLVAVAVLFSAAPTYAQNSSLANHAFAIGKGTNVQGFKPLGPCVNGAFPIGQTGADPICQSLSGDVTMTAGGVATLATVNANVGSWGSATQAPVFTVDAKGRITAAANATITPAVTNITGLGTNVASALQNTVNSASGLVTFNGVLGTVQAGSVLTNATGYLVSNLVGAGTGVLAALAVNIGSAGAPVLFNGALGTPSSGVGSNLTALNATQLTSGTVPAARLPNPSASTLGGIQSLTCAANQWLNTISTAGVPSCAQPAFSNLSGNIAISQINSGTGASSSTFLRGDNTWATPAGAGTVTSVQIAPGNGARVDGTCTITGAGVCTVTPIPRNYKTGLTLSTAGASATYGIAIGIAADSTNADTMYLASAYTKTTSSWAVGTATGSLDTGAIANSTWYHAFIIKRPDTGVVDVCVSTSVTGCAAGVGNIPAAYTLSRRIGSMKTNGSAQWTLFKQFGDDFYWDVRVVDVNGTTTSTTGTLTTLTVPTGVQVNAFGYVRDDYVSGATSTLVTSPDESDQVVNAYVQNVTVTVTLTVAVSYVNSRTNTSAQLRFRSSGAGATQGFATTGWTDTCGR